MLKYYYWGGKMDLEEELKNSGKDADDILYSEIIGKCIKNT